MEQSKDILIFSVSGLRGIVGRGLYPDVLSKYSSCFGNFVGGKKIVIGTDTRNTKDLVRYAAVSGLMAVGSSVIDVGIAPTPTIQYITEKYGFDGGIVITASHNPPEWNALKFIKSDGTFLNSKDLKGFQELMNAIEYRTYESIGEYSRDEDIKYKHIEDIRNFVAVKAIKKSCINVVFDPGCGAGAVFDGDFGELLGISYKLINDNIDGVFKRKLEPTPDALVDLGDAVKKTEADIGFAQDTDADRLAVVDENGKPIGEEYTLALALYQYLKKEKTDIVVNLSTSKIIDWIANRFGVRVYRAKVGEINVVEKMKEIGAYAGGEGNGGVIIPRFHYGRDSFIGMALILELLAEEKRSVSQILKEFPKYFMIKEKISVKDIDYEKLKEHYKKKAISINLDDGLRIDYEDLWFHIRKSNTENVVRIIVEGEDRERVYAFLEDLKQSL